MSNTINSKRFVIRKSLINKNTTINVTFNNGKSCTYNHDEVYNVTMVNHALIIMMKSITL